MRYHHTFYTSHLFHCGWRTLTTRDARTEPVYLLVVVARCERRPRRRRISDADRVRRRCCCRCHCHIVRLLAHGGDGGGGGWWRVVLPEWWRRRACVLHADAGEWKNNTGPSAREKGSIEVVFLCVCVAYVCVCVAESLCMYV